jgi:cytochrome c
MVRTAISISVIVVSTGGAFAEADLARGEAVYAEKCAACHSTGEADAGKRGPDLANVIDRPAAAVEGFKYSDAMIEAAQAGLVWNLETLSQFVTKPRKVVNGSFMNFTGLSNTDDVANVIAYIATFSPPPAQ